MVLPPERRQAALIRAAFRCSSHIPIQPKEATPDGVGSDVTRLHYHSCWNDNYGVATGTAASGAHPRRI